MALELVYFLDIFIPMHSPDTCAADRVCAAAAPQTWTAYPDNGPACTPAEPAAPSPGTRAP